jgi:hypothetical protein
MGRVPLVAVVVAAVSVLSQAQEAATHAPDGGTQQFLQSIDIAPIPNAPFSAVVRTEWTRILPDGSRGAMYNHRIVARDSSGRVFQERRFFDPQGNTIETRLSQLQYDDPVRHERTLCYPQRTFCEVFRLPAAVTVAPLQPGPLPNGAGTLQREDLGHKSMENLDVVGTREITTLAAGAFGNEKPEPVVKEFWYAPRLGINVVTKRFDPRASAAQNFTVTDVNLSEPNPKLFEPSGDFQVVRSARY